VYHGGYVQGGICRVYTLVVYAGYTLLGTPAYTVQPYPGPAEGQQ